MEVTVSKLSPLSEETPSRLVSLQNSPVKRTRAPPSASAVSEDDVFMADSRWIILKNFCEEALYFSPAPIVIDKAHFILDITFTWLRFRKWRNFKIA